MFSKKNQPYINPALNICNVQRWYVDAAVVGVVGVTYEDAPALLLSYAQMAAITLYSGRATRLGN
ncbi:MAG TPA: hypothetical protein V6D30_15375 [Leptolyngbyaceae cyanobacterium]